MNLAHLVPCGEDIGSDAQDAPIDGSGSSREIGHHQNRLSERCGSPGAALAEVVVGCGDWVIRHRAKPSRDPLASVLAECPYRREGHMGLLPPPPTQREPRRALWHASCDARLRRLLDFGD